MPSSATTRCGTARIGASEQTVSAPVRKFARVGRPARCGSSSATTSARRSVVLVGGPHGVDGPGSLRLLPAVRGCDVGEQPDGAVERAEPVRGRPRPVELAERRREPVDELRQPPDQVHVARPDVVDRQDRADEALVLLGHRHPEQEPVQRRRPRALRRATPSRSAPAATRPRPSAPPTPAPTPARGRAPRRRSRTVGGPAPGRRGRPPPTPRRASRRAPAGSRRRRAPGWRSAAHGRRSGPAACGRGAPGLPRRRPPPARTRPRPAARTPRRPGTSR